MLKCMVVFFFFGGGGGFFPKKSEKNLSQGLAPLDNVVVSVLKCLGTIRGWVGWMSFVFFSFFPTCQVRVVRFYVSLLLLSPPFSSASSSSVSSCDDVWSVWRAGPQPRAYEARRAGPQPPSCAASVACRASTAIM